MKNSPLNYNEDEWISYYEARIEPDAIQMSNEYTRKLFSSVSVALK